MEKIVSLCKRRGFIFPGSEIYGGMANSWDYGPLGVEMKNNIKQEWWKRFVRGRRDMVGIDAALIMNPKVWEASGHLKNFTDPLVDCKKCQQRFRADKIPADHAKTCGGTLTDARQFNLMFKTFIGPAEESANIAYFRPETAQAMFVDFKNVAQTTRKRLPFGIAQIGKAFRNEITPGNFIFRTREFEQMEIEYFIHEQDWEKSFEMWHEEMLLWIEHIGIPRKKMHLKEVEAGERAHYSKRTVDFEYPFPFGVDELYGLAYRTDFDLKNHAASSGQDVSYVDAETNEKITPHVIEPTWGVDRTLLAALVEAYTEEAAPTAEDGKTETRVVLRLPKWLAPIKVAILPLSKKEALSAVAEPLYRELSQQFFCEYDETQSIGKRYRRQDEIGTPYCVTVDFESLEDKAVTIRDRDTMKQERVPIAEVKEWIQKGLST
ncbi:MAG: glycine--tRNA ligase [Candidatus Magasanikbacteria bacterium]|nr:glycine--tRNA ligase [Candidatus Magasanikbacteria bacterium]